MITLADEPDFDFGSAEYRTFFARFGLTPFQHPDWLGPFYRRLPHAAGHRPLILVGRDPATRELAALIPLLRDDSGARPCVTFAFLGVTDYACPVLDPARSAGVSLPSELDRIIGEHDLDVRPIHDEHRVLWENLCGRVPAPLDFGAHAVSVGQPVTDWRSVNYGSRLRTMGRKMRRLAELGELRLEIASGSEAHAAMARARSLRAGRFAGDPLQVDGSAAFYADVAASPGGLARTFQLRSGDRIAAVMFGLVHGRRFHYLVLACNYAEFAKFSPGLMIMDLAIEAWIAAGGEVFDFTIGDEPFKAAFGCTRTPMYAIRTGALPGPA